MKLEKYDGHLKFKSLNNKDIPIVGQPHMELSSGSWKATKCKILVVENQSQNLMGKDIQAKLGLTLNQQLTNKGTKNF